MTTIIGIATGSTEMTIKRFKEVFESLTEKKNAVYARIRHSNYFFLLDYNAHPLEYPLVIYTLDGYAFCLADVTAGYPGTGPHGMVEILKYLDFSFNENDILSHQSNVCMNISKGGISIREEFKRYKLDSIFYLNSPFKR